MDSIRELEKRYRFFVNPEKRVVVAKISEQDLIDIFVNEAADMIDKSRTGIDYLDDVVNWLAVKNVSSGLICRARCDERDEFDPEFGKRLAARRLTMKICFLKCEMYRFVSLGLYEMFCNVKTLHDKYLLRIDNLYESIEQHIDSLN